MDPIQQKLKALEFFKDWTNYLLVTTVAAMGWVSVDKAGLSPHVLRICCIAAFAGSILFAILTLALIPHVAEQISDKDDSIYDVYGEFHRYWLWGPIDTCRLTSVCWPQHVLFLLGIVLYALGSSRAK
jgi:hypothetical protein